MLQKPREDDDIEHNGIKPDVVDVVVAVMNVRQGISEERATDPARG